MQNLALSGETVKLIKLLEDGAPFVVDMVREKIYGFNFVEKI